MPPIPSRAKQLTPHKNIRRANFALSPLLCFSHPHRRCSTMRFSVIALALAIDEEGNEPFIHSRNRKEYYKQLSQEEKRRHYCRLPRCVLLLQCKSSLRRVYDSQSDQAMIILTGVDFATFHFIHDRFAMWFNTYTPFTKDGFIRLKKVGKGGHPRLMSSYVGLGLTLTWTRTRGSQMVLQMMFGMMGTCTSDYLSFLMIILVRVLSKWMMHE